MNSSTGIEQLPKSVGKLQFLETLDIRYTKVRTLPSTIGHLKSLCCLRGGLSLQADPARSGGGGDPWGMDVPKDIGKLQELKTTGTLSIRNQDRQVLQELSRLTQLQRLSVTGITDRNGPDLCSTLKHLSCLQSLALHSPGFLEGLPQSLLADSLQSPLERLEVLKLYGNLPALPQWISGLWNLFKLYLRNTKLEGPLYGMNVLEHLPNLTTLLLLKDSILAPQLTFKYGAFEELELLELSCLADLASLAFKAWAMPKIKTLHVNGCNNLDGLLIKKGAMAKPETLEIKYCYGLRLVSFEGASVRMPMLKKFQVGDCKNLRLLKFAKGDMPNLETLPSQELL